ncbi:MAG TPA: ABC transporter permease [Clostridiaceae bacterium]|nr:ABC transporter permease [Clostridiaceae bacterium]
MKARHVWIVFKKEVKDIIRDKRTVITNIVIPMILIPLINILVGGGVEKLQRDIEENITITLSETSRTDEIKNLVENEIFKDKPNIRLVDTDNPIDAVRDADVRLVLDFDSDYKQKLTEEKPFVIKLMYDKSSTKSEAAVSIVSQAINEYNMRLVAQRLTQRNIDLEILEPARVEPVNVAKEGQGGNMVLMMTLPMIIAILVVVGGIPAATDLVAGEKERNTFEPLLTTKPDRASILMGKYLTVTLFSFVSIVAIGMGFVIGYIINPNSITMGTGEQLTGASIPPLALVLSILITVILGMMFAGIQIALSAYARSFKEAQTYLSFLIFAAMIPAYATMFTQPADIKVYVFLIPILNTISAFKMVLGGVIDYTSLLVALVSSIIYLAITLAITASMFNKEKVLFRS